MELKFRNRFRLATVLFTFAPFFTSVAAQTIPTPSKLSGRWSTLDGLYSQTISANIDPATSKGTLTVWSNDPICTVRDAPITVTFAGETLSLRVDSSYSNRCRSDIAVELTKKADSDDYEGELHQGGPAGARFPILRVKMNP